MHYVYLTNNVVTDQCQVDPFTIFAAGYAEGFIEAPDDVTFGWTYADGQFSPPPGPSPEQIQAANKAQASSLLQATDWVNEKDVIDPNRTPHLLNANEFLDYREILRGIAVNPPVTPVVDWPVLPTEQWSQ